MLDLPVESIGPGVYPNMPTDVYRAHPAAHYSALKDVAISPAYYQWRLHNRTETAAMSKGTAVGLLLSDGIMAYRNRYVTPPANPDSIPISMELAPAGFTGLKKPDKELIVSKLAEGIIICKEEDFDELGLRLANKAGIAWKAQMQAQGKIPISLADDLDVTECVEAIKNHRGAGPIVSAARHEVSIIYVCEYTGALCKCRIDIDCAPVLLADLKTTADCSQKAFNRSIERFSYHWQAAMYLDAARAEGIATDATAWRWIVAEPHPPYHVRFSEPARESDLAIGRDEYLAALRLLQACKKSDKWPADNGEPVEYGLSKFYGR